jgi:hypothetical protein
LFTTGYKRLVEGGHEAFGFWLLAFWWGRFLDVGGFWKIAGGRLLKGENEWLKGNCWREKNCWRGIASKSEGQDFMKAKENIRQSVQVFTKNFIHRL